MKTIHLIFVLCFFALEIKADIIHCRFSEPFITSTYSTTQSRLTYKDSESNTLASITNVSLQIKGLGLFELVSKEGLILQKLELNQKGRDGMSDTKYPYTVIDSHPMFQSNRGYGGCWSNYLKPTPPKAKH